MKEFAEKIRQKSSGQRFRLMEVCGTHTVSISRSGLRALLSPEIELTSGPGCPVCVTPASDIAKAIWLAESGKTLFTFGDMMKVPVDETSLFSKRSEGAKIVIAYSPLEAVDYAAQNPDDEVVFIGVGFETTAPTIAGAIEMAHNKNIENYSVLCSVKTIPLPLEIICNLSEIAVDGFILPGHVSAIIGAKPYRPIAEKYGKPGVVAGFETKDILTAIDMLVDLLLEQKQAIEIAYTRIVTENGNIAAQQLIDKVFKPCDSSWRGLGILPGSGLAIRNRYASFDAQLKFDIPDFPDALDNPACKCDKVILGILKPNQCPLFGKQCTPRSAQGPCMISSEGVCAAYFKYGE